MRRIYQGGFKDGMGNAVSNGTVTAYLAGGTTLATIYAASSGGVAISGSVVTSDADGAFNFWVEPSEFSENQLFKIVLSKAGYKSKIYDNLVLLTQVYDKGLDSIAGLTTAANKMIYTTAEDVYAVTDLTAAGRMLLKDQVSTTVASATTTTLATTVIQYITGTVPITAFNSVAGAIYHCRTEGALPLIHSAGLYIVQGAVSWTLEAGATFDVYMLTATTCEVRNIQLINKSQYIGHYITRIGTQSGVLSIANLGSGVVLVGTRPTAQIYKSSDSGASWTNIQRLGTETYVYSMVSLGSGVVLAGTYPTGQIYKSTDSGASWTLIQQLGTETYVLSLVSLGGGVVLAGTASTGQIYKSIDSGATWALIGQLGTRTQVWSLVSLGGGVVLAGTGTSGEIYKSIDSGASWSLVQRLGTETQVYSLANLGNGVVLAGTSPTGKIYKSIDSGASWSLVQRLGTELTIYSLASLSGTDVMAGTSPTGQIYKSTNSGDSWSLIQRLGAETEVHVLSSLSTGPVIIGTEPLAQIFRATKVIL